MTTFAVRMKRKRGFIWLLTALFVVCLTVLTDWHGHAIAPSQTLPEHTELSVMTSQRQQPHETTLTDSTQLYRICSSRPQRILPTHGSRSERTQTPLLNAVKRHLVKSLHSHHDSRCRLESAPFCLSASCDYYVIALRHIIR